MSTRKQLEFVCPHCGCTDLYEEAWQLVSDRITNIYEAPAGDNGETYVETDYAFDDSLIDDTRIAPEELNHPEMKQYATHTYRCGDCDKGRWSSIEEMVELGVIHPEPPPEPAGVIEWYMQAIPTSRKEAKKFAATLRPFYYTLTSGQRIPDLQKNTKTVNNQIGAYAVTLYRSGSKWAYSRGTPAIPAELCVALDGTLQSMHWKRAVKMLQEGTLIKIWEDEYY